MKQRLYILIGSIVMLVVLACNKDEVPSYTDLDRDLEAYLRKASPNGQADHFVLPHSSDFDNIPQDPKNPLNAMKVTLGSFLFHETGLALSPAYDVSMQSWSCASCHVATAGFMPGAPQGIADGGVGFGLNGESRTMNPIYDQTEIDAQGVRAISLLNAAYVTNAFWNGQFGAGGANIGTENLWHEVEFAEINFEGFSGLESQTMAGLEIHRMLVNKDICDDYGYTPLFDAAFPEVEASERYSKRTAAMALAAYLRILFTDKAPFQQWLKGDKDALSVKEKRGALLFFGKAKCYNCHNNTSLNSNEFHALGTKDLHETGMAFNTSANDDKNLGRGGFTKRDEDMYRFKVPQLYNMKNSPFYFHGSSKNSLREVVEFFNDGQSENAYVDDAALSAKFKPLGLSDIEIDDLVLFLENGLDDPYVERYMPSQILSGNCFPSNDEQARLDMGCE